MSFPLVTGTMLTCTFGATPSTFNALPLPGAPKPGVPAATIVQTAPMANIVPFGMCSSPSNPQVAAATSAAGGTLTPQPCVPVTAGPWVPGSPTMKHAGVPLATTNDKCPCAWGGMISVSVPVVTTFRMTP